METVQYINGIKVVTIKTTEYSSDHFCDNENKQKRIDICNTCPFKLNNTCTLCGCDINTKTSIKSEICPDGKWLNVS